MRFSDLLSSDVVDVQLECSSKEEILLHLIAMLSRSDIIVDREKVQEVIFERERIMSTGVGHGFACPHAKTDAIVDTAAALITLKNPVDFQSLDQQPVSIVVMLLGPAGAVGLHLRLLSRVSRLMSDADFRRQLLAAGSAGQILELLNAEEAQKLDV